MKEPKQIKELIPKAPEPADEFIDDVLKQDLYSRFELEVDKILKRKGKKYSYKMETKEDKHFVGTVIRYFSKSKEFYDSKIIVNEPSLHKGVLLLGGNGIGKSLIMTAMSQCNSILGYAGNNFKQVTCKKIVGLYDSEGYKAIEQFMVNSWDFDDIGTEPQGMHFGKRVEVMQLVMEERCVLFNRNGIKTHMSSNYDLKEFKARYGIAFFDRLSEMFNIVVYNRKESFRR